MSRHPLTELHHTELHAVDQAIRDLRARRIGYRAISEALDVFTELRLTEGQVRYRCRKLGLPADERKQRRWPTR